MSLPQELFEESYAVPFDLFKTNLDKLEIFLYARMWDDYEYHVKKHGFYAPFRGRLSAYVGSEREDTATAIVGRLIAKGYVRDTGRRFYSRPIYEVIDFRTIEGAIIKPSIAERSFEKTKERNLQKSENDFCNDKFELKSKLQNAENDFCNEEEESRNRKTSFQKSENDSVEIGKRVHSLYASPSNSPSKGNITLEEKEVVVIKNIPVTPPKKEIEESSKSVSLPLSDSFPSIVTSSLRNPPSEWLIPNLKNYPNFEAAKIAYNKLKAA